MNASPVPVTRLRGGVEAPVLGLGTFQLEAGACERTVRHALDLGYRHLDTAEGYGNEEAIGRAIRGVDRDSLFLVTKVWRDHLCPPDLRARCEASLRRLGTGYLDLYLVHWPNRGIPVERTLEGLVALREAGLIRAWGVSNFTRAHLAQLLPLEAPATNQVEIHPYFCQPALSAWCAERNVPLTAYAPLARGRIVDDAVLRDVAGKHRRSVAQVVLRWLVQRGHLAVPKATSPGHLEENLRIFDFRLTPADMARIASRPAGERLYEYEWSEFERRR